MSNFPINYTFVSRKKLNITEDNGDVKQYTILVLDDEANSNYFKKIESIKLTAAKAFDLGESIECWKASPKFIDLAIEDLMREEFLMNIKQAADPNEVVPTIFGHPVEEIDSDEAVCILKLANGVEIKNEFF